MKKMTPDTIMHYVEELLEQYGGRPAGELPDHYGQYECRVVTPVE